MTNLIYIIPSLYLPVSGWVLASRPPSPAFPPGRTHILTISVIVIIIVILTISVIVIIIVILTISVIVIIIVILTISVIVIIIVILTIIVIVIIIIVILTISVIVIIIVKIDQCSCSSHLSLIWDTTGAYLRDSAGDVGVKVEILLDGRHEDELRHKSVVRACRCEVRLKHLPSLSLTSLRMIIVNDKDQW